MGYGSHAELASACRRRRRTRSPTACRSRTPPACRSSSAPPTTACSSSATCRPARRCSSRPAPAASGWPRSSWPRPPAPASCSPRRRATSGSSGSPSTAWTTASTTPTEDVGAAVRELTDGRGVDLVVDPVGGRTLEASIAALAYRGRVSWVGRAGRDADPPEVWPLMEKNASLTGVFLGAEMGRDPRPRPAADRAAAASGSRPASCASSIDRVFPLAEAAEAHRYIESRQAFGRVLLRPDASVGPSASPASGTVSAGGRRHQAHRHQHRWRRRPGPERRHPGRHARRPQPRLGRRRHPRRLQRAAQPGPVPARRRRARCRGSPCAASSTRAARSSARPTAATRRAYPVQQADGTWIEVDRTDELVGLFRPARHRRPDHGRRRRLDDDRQPPARGRAAPRRRAQDDRQRPRQDDVDVRLRHRRELRLRVHRPPVLDGDVARPGDRRRGDGPLRRVDRPAAPARRPAPTPS